MSSEMCEASIIVSASGFEDAEAASNAFKKLSSKLKAGVSAGVSATEDGFGYTAAFSCRGFTSRGVCNGVCIKAKLQEMGKLETAVKAGKCLVEVMA